MIGIQSIVVVATAQSFIPAWVLGDDMSHREKVKDGVIIRDNAMLINDERAMIIQN